jgi:hypothetical protein
MSSDGSTKDMRVAAAADLPNAVVLAGAMYVARQNYVRDPSFMLGVFETATDTAKAFIGS